MYSLLEKGILEDSSIYPSTGNPYNYEPFIPALLSFVIGLLIGMFEVLILSKIFQRRSLFQKIFIKIIVYLAIMSLAILTIIVLSSSIRLSASPVDKQIWLQILLFFTNFAFLTILLYYSMAILLCLLYNEISDHIGQAVLLNFFTGKYHRPIEEERVYLFLDMKSSTTLAERLGHVRYFEMLNEYYSDLSDTIIQYGGEIYQYVGDEVVITWKIKKGFANNCLDCFFAMREVLTSKEKKYHSKYGVVPSFKAGIHFGLVSTGEIGVIKKEIIYSGDVLNTTARIQGHCNEYKVDILASEKFIKALETNKDFIPKILGETELRGRNEKINLFTVEKN